MADLDRNRPFTTAWGIVADDEPFFFQDGKEFYGDGTPVVVEETLIVPEEKVPAAVVKAPIVPEEKSASLADIANGKAAKKAKAPAKTAVAEPEEKLSAEVTHDFL